MQEQEHHPPPTSISVECVRRPVSPVSPWPHPHYPATSAPPPHPPPPILRLEGLSVSGLDLNRSGGTGWSGLRTLLLVYAARAWHTWSPTYKSHPLIMCVQCSEAVLEFHLVSWTLQVFAVNSFVQVHSIWEPLHHCMLGLCCHQIRPSCDGCI